MLRPRTCAITQQNKSWVVIADWRYLIFENPHLNQHNHNVCCIDMGRFYGLCVYNKHIYSTIAIIFSVRVDNINAVRMNFTDEWNVAQLSTNIPMSRNWVCTHQFHTVVQNLGMYIRDFAITVWNCSLEYTMHIQNKQNTLEHMANIGNFSVYECSV